MSFYDEMADIALELITEFGASISFSRVTEGVYDPASGKTIGDAEEVFSVNCVKDTFSSFERSDSSIEVGDIKLIAAATHDFAVDDTATINGLDYKLVMVDPIKPANTVVAYELQARR